MTASGSDPRPIPGPDGEPETADGPRDAAVGQPVAHAEPDPESEPDVEPESEPEPQVERDIEAEPEVEAESGPAVEPEPVVEPEPGVEPDPEVAPRAESEVEAEPEVTGEPEPAVEPEPEAAADAVDATPALDDPSVVEPLDDDTPDHQDGADDVPVDELSAPAEGTDDAADKVGVETDRRDAPQEATGPDDVDDVEGSDGTAAAPSVPAGSANRARSRLLSAMRPRASRGQLLAALLCAGLGFGLVVQVQATRTSELDMLRQSDLVRLLQQVTSESEKLATQEAEAQAAREGIVGSAADGRVVAEAAKERLQALGVLTGTVAASGPGIKLVIEDPKKEVDGATLLDALQELRDAGAEAVQIGSVRVVASTAFEDLDGGVRVGSVPVAPPYRYLVIGDAATLSAAMKIPGGVLDVLEQKGATGDVTEVTAPDRVEITALHVLPAPEYARPAADSGP